MTKTQAKRVIKRLENKGGEARIYEGYSGRCMYGRQTFGVVTDHIPRPCKWRTDNLGLDYILY